MHIYVRVESNGVLQNSQQRATTTQLDTFKAFSYSLKSNLIDNFFIFFLQNHAEFKEV